MSVHPYCPALVDVDTCAWTHAHTSAAQTHAPTTGVCIIRTPTSIAVMHLFGSHPPGGRVSFDVAIEQS